MLYIWFQGVVYFAGMGLLHSVISKTTTEMQYSAKNLCELLKVNWNSFILDDMNLEYNLTTAQ